MRGQIPVFRMLTMGVEDIDRRVRRVVELVGAKGTGSAGLARSCRIIDGASTTGGGSAPDSALPTRLIEVRAGAASASALDSRLRARPLPVVARIHDDAIVIDLRTVDERDDEEVARAIAESATS